MNISINAHSSIRVDDMHFDPFMINEKSTPAKMVFLTHTHYDHLSKEDVLKVIDKNTIILATQDAKEHLEPEFANQITYVSQNETLMVDDIKIETIPAYNKNKPFHPKSNNWVGYVITKDNFTFAVLGDTDAVSEHENLKLDLLFIPIGGTYTMNPEEAAKLTNKIKPKLVIPTHYGSIVGQKEDSAEFIKHLNKDINYKIII